MTRRELLSRWAPWALLLLVGGLAAWQAVRSSELQHQAKLADERVSLAEVIQKQALGRASSLSDSLKAAGKRRRRDSAQLAAREDSLVLYRQRKEDQARAAAAAAGRAAGSVDTALAELRRTVRPELVPLVDTAGSRLAEERIQRGAELEATAAERDAWRSSADVFKGQWEAERRLRILAERRGDTLEAAVAASQALIATQAEAIDRWRKAATGGVLPAPLAHLPAALRLGVKIASCGAGTWLADRLEGREPDHDAAVAFAAGCGGMVLLGG